MSAADRAKPRQTNKSPIAQLRLSQGMTQAQLATKVGCYTTDISRWESGKHKPGIQYIIKLADALGCTIDKIVGG